MGDLIVSDQPGDLRAANAGVTILRDRVPIYQPVLTPTQGAVGVGATQLVVAHAGSLWLVSADGQSSRLYSHADRVLDVVDLPGFGLGGWVAFTQMGRSSEGESYNKYLGLLSLNTETVILLPVEIGEGGVTGVAAYGDFVVVGASTDGPAFFEAWTNAGPAVLLWNNPAPRDTEDWYTRRNDLTSAGPDLLAYTELVQLVDAEEYLVLFDPDTGRELAREEIPGSAETRSDVWGLDADSERVVVTTGIYSLDEGRFHYMAHEFDRTTGMWSAPFEVPGPVRLAKWLDGYQLAGG